MITWTGSTIEIGDATGGRYSTGFNIVLDAEYRNDTNVIVSLYMRRGDGC